MYTIVYIALSLEFHTLKFSFTFEYADLHVVSCPVQSKNGIEMDRRPKWDTLAEWC